MTLKDIYNVIKAKYGVNVSAFVEDKKDDTVEDYELSSAASNCILALISDDSASSSLVSMTFSLYREQSIKKLESTIEDLKNTVELNESTIEAKDKEVEELRSRLKAL